MSASGMDVDVENLDLDDMPDAPPAGAQDTESEPDLPVDFLLPVEFTDPRIAQSGVVGSESEAGVKIEQIEQIDESDESDEQELFPLPLEGKTDGEVFTVDGELETLPEFLLVTAAGEDLNVTAAADSTGANDAPADAATATTPAPYSQYIVLNGLDNAAVLEDNGNLADDLVQLRSTNGTFDTTVFRLPTDVLVIELGGGNDSLVVQGLELGSLTANVFINGQGGDDAVNLRGLQTVNDVYVTDMEGDNRLDSVGLNIGGNLFVSDGDGDQNAFIGGTVNGDVNISSTNGGSEITLGRAGMGTAAAARIHGSVTIANQGTGSDSVRFSGGISGDFYIDAGDGDFELRSIFSSVGDSLFVNVDSGDSTIFLGDFSVGEQSYFINGNGDTDTWLTAAFFNNGLTIQNGLGFDELRLDGTQILTAESAGTPGLLTVNNGDGGSSTALNRSERLFSLRIGEFRLSNGVGTDTIDINLRDRDTLNTFYADNGPGDTTRDITGTGTMQAVTLISDDGNDDFSIDGVDIQNDLIIRSGAGESTVDIQNSEIGNTDISGAETETVAGAGDDEIYLSAGNNIIDGGAGDDVLYIYQGVSTDFDITYEADGRVIVEGPGLNGATVRHELTNVERIIFNDKQVFLNDPGTGGPSTIFGTDADDWIAVPERGGNVEAGAGDDSIYAPSSQTFNEIDGGSGTDTLIIYQGGVADYILRRPTSSSFVEVEGPGMNGSTVINRLTDVEFIGFTDSIVRVADLEITPGILRPATT